MHFLYDDVGSFVISGVEEPLQQILAAIPLAAQPGDSVPAKERLFPEPATGKDAAEISEEWREYVEPGLRHLFEEAVVTVAADLKQLEGGGETLTIVRQNIDAWLNTLNQARLVLAARFNVTEADMDGPASHLLTSDRDFALFQIYFYGALQEFMIQGIDEG